MQTLLLITQNPWQGIPAISSEKLYDGGAGFMDVYHGNKTIVFRHIESSLFDKPWLVDDVASALQLELNLYYPDYLIRSH